MPVVTIAASFGTGGSAVATDIAKRLSWQMFDRAIPLEVARRLSIPLEDALSHDEHRENRTAAVFSQLARAMIPIAGIPVAIEVLDDTDYKRETEAVIRSLADPLQKAVVLGRGAALILGDEPGALHVRLDGPPRARASHAMKALDLTQQEAAEALRVTDAARAAYMRHFYGADWADPRHYHLVIDSTAISADCCREVILAAARDRFGM
jgi:cytidylate kinase